MRILAYFAALWWGLCAASASYACSCGPYEHTLAEDVADYYDAVFVGIAEKVTQTNAHDFLMPQVARFQVVSGWKGVQTSTPQDVYGCENSAACCLGFEEGKAYVVLAKRNDDGHLAVRMCDATMRTMLLEHAGDLVKELNDLTK